jgi:hypothetical protein
MLFFETHAKEAVSGLRGSPGYSLICGEFKALMHQGWGAAQSRHRAWLPTKCTAAMGGSETSINAQGPSRRHKRALYFAALL